jgi:hypothetical protein
MTQKIKLGYSIPEGNEIFIIPSHLIVTGITQQSGKTTTLEALMQRAKLKAIVFKTKIGEKSFTSGSIVPPFFRDRSDYEFVRSLIEAYSKEKLFIEKGTLMNLCKGSNTLVQIKQRVDEELGKGKLRGIKEEIYTRLQHYLENLIPQIQYANFSSTLNITEGVNIMDLERFSDEAQSLIIRSVADEVLKNHRDIIIVIPEAWKFLPQRHNNPCKYAVESFIRQGATNKNFIWIDSQDMSGVDKTPLKQISTWILGYQSERNEVKHTLDQISLPKKSKPAEDDIMNLSIGQFFLSSRDQVVKVYVQPAWMENEVAKEVATGKKEVSAAASLKPLPSFSFPTQPKKEPLQEQQGYATKKELTEVRMAFFTKIEQLVADINNYLSNLSSVGQQSINEEHIVSLVLQKVSSIKTPAIAPGQTQVDYNKLAEEVSKRIPRGSGDIVYEVVPLEKIKKDFLVEINNRITADISQLSTDEKKALKYIEVRDSDVTASEMINQCFILKPGGSASTKISNIFKELVTIDVLEKTAGGRYRKGLRKRISTLMGAHNATDQEIQNAYDHLLSSLI